MIRRGIALTASLWLLAAPAMAQGTSELTLAEAVLLARDNSLAAMQSERQVQAAQAQRAVTVGNALPTFSLQTSANYNQLPASSGLAQLFGGSSGGGLVGFPAQGVTADTTLQGNIVLFDAFATRDAIKIADYQLYISRLGAYQAKQESMVNAAVAYFDVLRAEGLAKVAQDGVKQAQEHLRLGDLKLRAGTGTRAETLQLRAQLANAQGQLTQARNGVTIARLRLSNVLNAPVADTPLFDNPKVPALDVAIGEQLPVALARRTEVQQLEARKQISETQIDLESRATWPNLQGTTRYSQRGLNAGQFLAGVTANWALFDGFKARNRMEVARSQAQADLVQLEQTRQNIALEIRQQYQTREEAQSRVAVAREGLQAAQEAYRLAVKRYEVGLATPFELTDVQTTAIQSGNNYVQAINDLRVAQIRLARAMGVDLGAFVASAPTAAPGQ